jgi:flagellin
VSGTISAVSTTTLTLNGHVISSQATATSAVTAIASAVTVLGTRQGAVGQIQNRLQYAIALAQQQVVSNTAAESRIRDANVAEESSNLTRFSILNQSGIAVLAQANSTTSSVLALLR